MNKRKSPTEEYIEELRQLCASLDEDAVKFFHAMEEQGIEMKTDTGEHDFPIGDIVFSHLLWMQKLALFLIQNGPIMVNEDLMKSMPDKYQMTPEEIFNTLSIRTHKVQEEVLKLACSQYVITGLLQSLQENNLTGFLTIFEENKLDMTDISKYLFMSDTSRFTHSQDEDIIAMECYYMLSFMEDLNNIGEASLPKEITQEVIHKRYMWVFGNIVNRDEMSFPNLVLSVYNKLEEVSKKIDEFFLGEGCVSPQETMVNIATLWEIHAKYIIVQTAKLSPVIKRIIRPNFAPYYVRYIVETYESEWECFLKEEESYKAKMTAKSSELHIPDQSAAEGLRLSLPEDFFNHKNLRDSFHMDLRQEIISVGVKKFETFLNALSDYGYISRGDLPLLAYRLTGCGEHPFGEEQIIWHEEPRVIRYIVSKFHAPGANYASRLDKYFIEPQGNTFLRSIKAGYARNIKKLPIFKEVIMPLYGDIIE